MQILFANGPLIGVLVEQKEQHGKKDYDGRMVFEVTLKRKKKVKLNYRPIKRLGSFFICACEEER